MVKLFHVNPVFDNITNFWNTIMGNELTKAGYSIYSPVNEALHGKTAERVFIENTRDVLNTNVLVVNLDELENYPEEAAYCGLFWTLKTQTNDLVYKGIIGYCSKPIDNYVSALINDIGKVIKIDIPKDITDNDTELYRLEAQKVVDAINKLI